MLVSLLLCFVAGAAGPDGLTSAPRLLLLPPVAPQRPWRAAGFPADRTLFLRYVAPSTVAITVTCETSVGTEVELSATAIASNRSDRSTRPALSEEHALHVTLPLERDEACLIRVAWTGGDPPQGVAVTLEESPSEAEIAAPMQVSAPEELLPWKECVDFLYESGDELAGLAPASLAESLDDRLHAASEDPQAAVDLAVRLLVAADEASPGPRKTVDALLEQGWERVDALARAAFPPASRAPRKVDYERGIHELRRGRFAAALAPLWRALQAFDRVRDPELVPYQRSVRRYLLDALDPLAMEEPARAADALPVAVSELLLLLAGPPSDATERVQRAAAVAAAIADHARAVVDCAPERSELERAFHATSATPAVRWHLGWALAQLLKVEGDRIGALDVYEEILTDPLPGAAVDAATRARARLDAAAVRHEIGDARGATREFAQLLADGALLPEELLLHAWQAVTLAREHPGELAALERRLAIAPAGERPIDRARRLVNLAHVELLRSGAAEAEKNAGLALDLLDGMAAPRDEPARLLAVQNRAGALRALGRFDAARTLEEETLSAWPTATPDEPVDVHHLRNNLCFTLAAMGDGEALARRLLELADAERARLLAAPPLAPQETASALAARSHELQTLLSLTPFLRSLKGDAAALRRQAEVADQVDRRTFEIIELTRALAAEDARLIAWASTDLELHDLWRGYVAAKARAAEDVATAGRRGDLKALAASIRAAASERDRLAHRIVARLQAGGERRPAADARAMANALAPDEAAISFRVYTRDRIGQQPPSDREPALVAFVLRHDGTLTRVDDFGAPWPKIRELIDRWLEKVAGVDVRRDIATLVPEPAGPPGIELFERLLAPLLPHVGGASVLRVCLDDALFLVPLDALELPNAGRKVYVGDRYSIVNETSLASLPRRTRREWHVGPSLLAFGAVDYDAEPAIARAAEPVVFHGSRRPPGVVKFQYLDGTRQEVDSVVKLFGQRFGGPVYDWRGAAATKECFLAEAPKARVIHLATHGLYLPHLVHGDGGAAASEQAELDEEVRGLAPLTLGMVAFASANRVDAESGRVTGILSAEEVAAMHLPDCELAVVSSCQSHAGVAASGQGVASLQSALHVAGVDTSITTIWPVNDLATARLMESFYREYWQVSAREPRTTAPAATPPAHAILRALWNAKRELREELPFAHWAGFVVSGRG